MAFEYGLLGRSCGGGPAQELGGLLNFLGSNSHGVTYGSMKQGEGWASARIRFSATPDGSIVEQNVQVSVGGEIVDIFLQEAQSVISADALEGRDLMVTVSISGPMDVAVNRGIIAYAQARWKGIPWDEVSGFQASFDRP